MCGFVGFTNNPKLQDRENILSAMTEAIHHRGPDSDGQYVDEHIALGFRRLSIIDLSDDARQPMISEDENLVMVFNGEIYNFEEIKKDLIADGFHFKSHSDSEVLLNGYKAYGMEILGKLRGMFAFAIWDKAQKELFIARDFFGIKPLYYTESTSDGTFIFGSEIKSFLKHPSFIKSFNDQALKPYLTFQYSVLDETYFSGVYKLKPAHYMRIKAGEIEIKPYWHNTYEINSNDLMSNVEQIKSVMKSSVEYHKISDVKVGAFLSGGVDSSYITALLKPNKTFSVGFSDYEAMYNETDLAEALSEQLGIENHKKLITSEECFDALPEIMYHMDEPQSNPSVVPLYFLAELASRHVTVVLSGEGADELFGGYVWYQNSSVYETYSKIPLGIRQTLGKVARKLPEGRITNFMIKAATPIEEKFIGQAKVFEESDALKILKAPYKDGPDVKSITDPVYNEVKNQDDLTKMQFLDLNLWLPGDILLKADKMSMAHSIELRVPFLDKEVIKVASSLPKLQRVNKIDTKYALRKAAGDILPEEWANRPKVGFPVPIRHWFRTLDNYNRIKEKFASDTANTFFHTDQLMSYLDEHFQNKANHARYIWTVFVFLTWYDVYFVNEEHNN
ncbi:MAG: asparagine synthase (glutamine-hydrolyzing) [Clostridiales bacterium]|nr:asparagine synthase (glutamine-hydrolyzing) [Clostridiales bacterium]